ncbi:hypothetical protein OTU49_005562 [Cherax quadricarinatus]|uniref:C-type lectin domain-containing protein n=1 Tax=Cherax quadricarinatus TaxID=27406 RepID=A0AAW0X670_CHEQU
MVPARLVKLLVLSALLFAGAEASCLHTEIGCNRGSQCISITNVCNSVKECSDGSDEDPFICEFWRIPDRRPVTRNIGIPDRRPVTRNIDGWNLQNDCSEGYMYCGSTCYSIYQACSNSECSSRLSSRMCEMITQRKLDLPVKGTNMTHEMVTLLASAVNITLNNRKECPMLYTRIGDYCLALFSPAKVSWPEARQFCRSIYGDLSKFEDFRDFGLLLQYMRAAKLTTDYWIGGRFDLDTNAWSWTVDDSTMPLGSPYWAERYIGTCTRRPPPHTDPFSNPPAALPGAACYQYTQAPKNRQQGWCSALTYEHFYYINDEICQEERSPLCMLVDTEKDLPEGEPKVEPDPKSPPQL